MVGELLGGAFKSKDPAPLVLQMRNPRQKDLEAELDDLTITVLGYKYAKMLRCFLFLKVIRDQ